MAVLTKRLSGVIIPNPTPFTPRYATTSLVAEISPQAQIGAAFGLMFAMDFGLGSMSTTLVGYIGDTYGLVYSYEIMTLISLVALVISLFLPAERKSSGTTLVAPIDGPE